MKIIQINDPIYKLSVRASVAFSMVGLAILLGMLILDSFGSNRRPRATSQ